MGNLGKAQVKVTLFGGSLVNVDQTHQGRSSFDFNVANDWDSIRNNNEFPPRNIEVISDEVGFSVMHPSKRFMQINNRMAYLPSSGGTSGGTEIIWQPLVCKRTEFNGAKHLQDLIGTTKESTTNTTTNTPANTNINSGVDNDMDPHPADGNYPTNYKGPQWRLTPVVLETTSNHDDQPELTGDANGSTTKPTSPPTVNKIASAGDKFVYCLEQHRIEPGLWWGAGADLNLAANLPFYLEINRMEPRPIQNQPTAVIIRINPPALDGNSQSQVFSKSPNKPGQSLDIVLEANKSIKIYDWAVSGDPNNPIFKPSETDTRIPAPSSGKMRIGFLPVCGRLALYFNGQMFLYSRHVPSMSLGSTAAKTFGFEPFTTKFDQIKVYGTNSSAVLSAAVMWFAIGIASLPFNGKINAQTGAGDKPWSAEFWKIPMAEGGANNSAAFGASYSNMPTATGRSSDWVLNSIKHVGYGNLQFRLGPAPNTGAASERNRFYYVRMGPSSHPFGTTHVGQGTQETLPIGPPFLQRLRASQNIVYPSGGFHIGGGPASVGQDISNHVVSIQDTWECSDRVHVTHRVEITLYNEFGQFDNLLERCYGVRVHIGWDFGIGVQPTKVFTGASYGGSHSYTANKETVVIHCEDYMALLDHTKMLNSPYYDGMDAYDAVQDLAQRARITTIDDTDEAIRFYLPSGYSWTQPKMRFNAQTSVKDNIVEICKLCERVVGFDENGLLRLSNLQGGLFGVFDSVSDGRFIFSRSPAPGAAQDDCHVILNEKRVEDKLGNAVNNIFIRTIDRLSGAVYLVSRQRQNYKFPYSKPIMMDQPSLGSIAAANNYADMLIDHFSRTPRSISFSTVLAAGVNLRPTDVIRVDDELMRVQSINRKFNAEDNSIETTLGCEWWN